MRIGRTDAPVPLGLLKWCVGNLLGRSAVIEWRCPALQRPVVRGAACPGKCEQG